VRPWENSVRMMSLAAAGSTRKVEDAIIQYKQAPEKFSSRLFVLDLLKGQDLTTLPLGETQPLLQGLDIQASTAIPFLSCGKVVVRPDQDLCRQLANTLLPIPVRMVRPPFDSIYIDLNEMNVHLEHYVGMRLRGVYCSIYRYKGAFSELGAADPARPDCLKVTVVADEPFDPANSDTVYVPGFALADAPLFPIDDDSVEDTIAGDKWNLDLNATRATALELVTYVRLCFGLCLYMSHPELKQHVFPKMHHQHDRMQRDLQCGKITEEMRKLINGGAGSVIKVKSAQSEPGEKKMSGVIGFTMPPHWRRGHWHLYWTGVGRAVEKYNWIKPILVNPEKMTGEVKPKTYEVS